MFPKRSRSILGYDNRGVPFTLIAGLVLLFFSGCTFTLGLPEREITILSYNVQNLFDDRANGNEYDEFNPNRSDWSTAEYYERLESLSRVIKDAVRGGPDVIALQEIEHLGVLETLKERFLGGMGYRYVTAVESDGAPIVVGVLSRLRVEMARTHAAHTDLGRGVRPMLEVRLDSKNETIAVFVCHWKSKSGGARETEPYRIAQATALAEAIDEAISETPDANIVVVGDLNESVDEYLIVNRAYPTALLPAVLEATGGDTAPIVVADVPSGSAAAGPEVNSRGVVRERTLSNASLPQLFGDPGQTPQEADPPLLLYSPWAKSTAEGSYHYRGVWLKIDHVLLSSRLFDGDGLEFAAFDVVSHDYLFNREGAPLKFRPSTSTGYSNHLPLLLTLAARR